MITKRIAQSGLFNRRALLICAATCLIAVPIISGLAFFQTEAPTKVPQRTLTFVERVSYQQAIEEVYWRHRMWPKERPDAKPSLDAVMSQAQLAGKVHDYLRKSQLVADNRGKPITASELQAEMDRMAQDTKQPEVLRELFEALGNDPFVIAECLARPILAERLVRGFNGESKSPQLASKANREPITNLRPSGLPTIARAAVDPPDAAYALPEISVPLGCTEDTWTATTLSNAPTGRYEHTAVWTGSEMIIWGGFGSNTFFNTGGRYNPSTDSWSDTSTTNAPAVRARHTAVWTGTEMIVWGGYGTGGTFLNTGGRYNPTSDSWIATSTTNAPTARRTHTVVWTGTEMIVWGGSPTIGTYLNTGGRYNPGTDSWTATNTTNAPTPRRYHSAVWTGSEMIVWGGYFQDNMNHYWNTGGKYDPVIDSWTATSTTNAPDGRAIHTAIWTGSQMVVWGGTFYDGNIEPLNSGGTYTPGTDSWTATSVINVPDARYRHTAVWTGSEMMVWGGTLDDASFLNTGGRYNISTDSWTAISTNNAPSPREDHRAVWTGSQMIVWGGFYTGPLYLNTGGRYCAQTGPTPTPTPTASATFTPTPMSCSVSSSTCGSTVFVPPTDFIFNVSGPVNPATVDASDLTVNNLPANSFFLSGGNTQIIFHFNTSPAVQGQNTMHIPVGAFDCGGPVQEFACTFTYQPSTPTPTQPPPSPTATATPTVTPSLTPGPSPTPRIAPSVRPRPTPIPRP